MNETLLALVEQTTCAAALTCSAETVRQLGLKPQEFWYASTRQVWGHLLTMQTPSIVLLMDADADLAVSAQAWLGRDEGVHNHPAGLEAHAALVRREARIRAVAQGNAQQINEIRAGKTTGLGGVSMEVDDGG